MQNEALATLQGAVVEGSEIEMRNGEHAVVTKIADGNATMTVTDQEGKQREETVAVSELQKIADANAEKLMESHRQQAREAREEEETEEEVPVAETEEETEQEEETPAEITTGAHVRVKMDDGSVRDAVIEGRYKAVNRNGKMVIEADAEGNFVKVTIDGGEVEYIPMNEASERILSIPAETAPAEDTTEEDTGEDVVEEEETTPTEDAEETNEEEVEEEPQEEERPGTPAKAEDPAQIEEPAPATPTTETPAPTERPAAKTYRELKEKLADMVGRKIEATVADRTAKLQSAKEKLQAAREAYADAPIGEDESLQKALEKAQTSYEDAAKDKAFWDEVMAEYQGDIAEAIQAEEEVPVEETPAVETEEEEPTAEEETPASKPQNTQAKEETKDKPSKIGKPDFADMPVFDGMGRTDIQTVKGDLWYYYCLSQSEVNGFAFGEPEGTVKERAFKQFEERVTNALGNFELRNIKPHLREYFDYFNGKYQEMTDAREQGKQKVEPAKKSTYERKEWSSDSDIEEMKAREKYLDNALEIGTKERAEVFPEEEEVNRERAKLQAKVKDGTLTMEQAQKEFDVVAKKYSDYFDRMKQVDDELHHLRYTIRLAEDRQRKEAETAAKTEAKKQLESKYHGFLKGKIAMTAANVDRTLSKKYRFNGQVMTEAQYVESCIKNGAVLRCREDNGKLYYSAGSYDLTKTAADYAKFLGAQFEGEEKATKEQRMSKIRKEYNDDDVFYTTNGVESSIAHYERHENMLNKTMKHKLELLREYKRIKDELKAIEAAERNAKKEKKQPKAEVKEDGLHEEWWDNGQLKSRITYKDGKYNGLYEMWDYDGQLMYRINYKDGKKGGLYEEWYSNGKQRVRVTYKDGKEDGLYEVWDYNGHLLSRKFFRDGKEIEMPEELREQEKQKAEETKVEPKEEKQTKADGKKDGLSEEWWDNGQLKSRITYKDGKKDGLYEEWGKDGKLRHRINYKDGKYNGLYEWWDKDGQLMSRINYKDDKKDGLSEEWWDSGQLKSRITYKDGKEDGLYEVWDYNGHLLSRKFFRDGKEVEMPEELREQRADAVTPVSEEETELRDTLAGIMQANGLEVIGDEEEGQRVLDEANGKTKLNKKQKRALETASVSQNEEHQPTVVSSADGAKVLKNIDDVASKYENLSNQAKTFIGDVAKALGAERHGSKSEYATFETKNGMIVTIRLADHNAKVSTFDNHGELNGISIVVSPKANEGTTNDGNAHVTEFFYDAIKLRRAEGKPLAEIVKSIKQALYSGEFKDTTGLAETQEVNAKEAARLQKVYHGSGAEFDHFDHSHMGEGEGAQVYGWGTYVTEVEGISRMYAHSAVDPYAPFRNMVYTGNNLTPEEVSIVAPVFNDGALTYDETVQWFRSIGNERSKRALAIMLKTTADEWTHPKLGRRILYTVDIPDDNGRNYLDWDAEPTKQQQETIIEALMDLNRDDVDDIRERLKMPSKYSDEDVLRTEAAGLVSMLSGNELYHTLSHYLGGDEIASKFLSQLGLTGIKYPADYRRGGRADGAKNYVIFNEADAKITDHVRFFRTENGEAYGFTVGGKIYYDPKIATSETLIHEYAHLWATAMRNGNPAEWQNIVELMKGTSVWEEVKRLYPELTNDNDIADEVLAHYSGRRGAERLREEQRKIARGEGSAVEKARAITAIDRVREALERFWKGVCDFLHIHYTTAEEVADRVMRDLLEGVDPRKFGTNDNVRMMGSRTDKHMAEIGEYFKGKDMSDEERAIVDVFSGKRDREVVSFTDKDGNGRKMMFVQGHELKAGSKHAIYRHYGEKEGWFDANEIEKIQKALSLGERTMNKGKIEYAYTDKENGVEYTVIAGKDRGKEKFVSFYTNRKAPDSGMQNTQESAQSNPSNALSAAKIRRNFETAEKNAENDVKSRMNGQDNGPREQRMESSAVTPVSEEETELCDTLAGIMQANGLEVIGDEEEGQQVLDEANGAREQRRSKEKWDNSGYTEREDGTKISVRAKEAEDEGTFSEGNFRKKYGVSRAAFDALVGLGVIKVSEWHHTGKALNKTLFYSWEDSNRAKGEIDYSNAEKAANSYASTYEANKFAISKLVDDFLAKELKFKAKQLEIYPTTYELFKEDEFARVRPSLLTEADKGRRQQEYDEIKNSDEEYFIKEDRRRELDAKYRQLERKRFAEMYPESKLRDSYERLCRKNEEYNAKVDSYNSNLMENNLSNKDAAEVPLMEVLRLFGVDEGSAYERVMTFSVSEAVQRFELKKAEQIRAIEVKRDAWLAKKMQEGRVSTVERTQTPPRFFFLQKEEKKGRTRYQSGLDLKDKRTYNAYQKFEDEITAIRRTHYNPYNTVRFFRTENGEAYGLTVAGRYTMTRRLRRARP